MPQSPGTYRVIATYNGDANYLTVAGTCIDANEQVVVSPATPGITTQVSDATRTIGQSFTDQATVTFPAAGPTPTGTVTSALYGPADTTCTEHRRSSRRRRSAAERLGCRDLCSLHAAVPGHVSVIATYNGDSNYLTVAGTCIDANEQVTVTQQTPGITTQVSNANRTVGQPFSDTATVTFLPAGPTPTGTVVFRLYGPTDTNCANTPIFTSAAITIDGAAMATAPPFTPQSPGTYRYIATYSGDANYTTIAGTCVDANEQCRRSRSRRLASRRRSPTPTRTIGQPFTDQATVSFPPAGPTPTGTVTSALYGPTDTTCAHRRSPRRAAIPLNGSAVATSEPSCRRLRGTYRVIATYNGDANYLTVAGTCIDANEQVTCRPASRASRRRSRLDAHVGQSFTDRRRVVPPRRPDADGHGDVPRLRPDRPGCANLADLHLANRPLNGSAAAVSDPSSPLAPAPIG